jgi:uncharacterized membrane protein
MVTLDMLELVTLVVLLIIINFFSNVYINISYLGAYVLTFILFSTLLYSKILFMTFLVFYFILLTNKYKNMYDSDKSLDITNEYSSVNDDYLLNSNVEVTYGTDRISMEEFLKAKDSNKKI